MRHERRRGQLFLGVQHLAHRRRAEPSGRQRDAANDGVRGNRDRLHAGTGQAGGRAVSARLLLRADAGQRDKGQPQKRKAPRHACETPAGGQQKNLQRKPARRADGAEFPSRLQGGREHFTGGAWHPATRHLHLAFADVSPASRFSCSARHRLVSLAQLT